MISLESKKPIGDGIEMPDVEVTYMKEDLRPAFVLNDVKSADFYRIKAQHAPDVPTFTLTNVENFSVQQSAQLPDTRLERVKQRKL